MPTFRLTLEYDGGGFHGWQRQPGQRTVEGELRAALRPLCGEDADLTAASRTDAGAHAHGQAVGLRTLRNWPPETLRRALKALLPPDVTVSAVNPAAEGFHARRDAVRRTYRYLVVPRRVPIARRFAWEISGPLDLDAMRRAATLLRGRHDFGAFGRAPRPGASTERTIHEVSVRRVSGVGGGEGFSAVVIEVTANAFLQGMMRSLAGALVAIGQGRLDGAALSRALSGSSRGAEHFSVAPARGLHQWSVGYAEVGA
ncbi:MAG: tRNA pseudouridine(38-40) synthase TruA [Candidatus Dormiibacterota bacterium]